MNQQPDTTTTRGKTEVMLASETKRILSTRLSTGITTVIPFGVETVWNWKEYLFQIHPDDLNPPQYRPWTSEEVPLLAKIENKSTGTRSVIHHIDNNRVSIGFLNFTFDDLLKHWVLEDGAPCGVKE